LQFFNIEDVLSFKSDIEAALKHMLKVRSRNKDVALIKQHFTLLLEENFDDIFPRTSIATEGEGDDDSRLSKKRARLSDSDVVDESVSKKGSRVVKRESEEDHGSSSTAAKMTSNQKVRIHLNCPVLFFHLAILLHLFASLLCMHCIVSSQLDIRFTPTSLLDCTPYNGCDTMITSL
jgi:hypothetical protein